MIPRAKVLFHKNPEDLDGLGRSQGGLGSLDVYKPLGVIPTCTPSGTSKKTLWLKASGVHLVCVNQEADPQKGVRSHLQSPPQPGAPKKSFRF